MDFHTLTRRELQTLCKKNKIPANMTNVAMADALKALEFVEGIEELLHPSESETAHPSIESPGKPEVTSPCVAPTGGRTTRRRNVSKEDPETLPPMTRSTRTTRRTTKKDESKENAAETPALVARMRKAPLSSACRKMDSQFQECLEEEKKDLLVTPAASGITSRRRRGVKEEGMVQTVYNTRRSARLVEKQVEVSDKVEIKESEPFQKDLFNKDSAGSGDNPPTSLENEELHCETEMCDDTFKEMNNDESLEDVPDLNANEEALKHTADADIDMGEESNDGPSGLVTSDLNANEEALENIVVADVDMGEVGNDGPSGLVTSDNSEELMDDICQSTDDCEVSFVSNFVNEDEAKMKSIVSDWSGFPAPVSEKQDSIRENEVKDQEVESQEANKEVSLGIALGDALSDDQLMSEHPLDELNISPQLVKQEPAKVETIQSDVNAEDADQAGDLIDEPNVLEADESALPSIEGSSKKQLIDIEGAGGLPLYSDSVLNFAGFETNSIAQTPRLTPAKSSASKTSVTKKRMTAVTDNKENIGSGIKLVLPKESVKITKNTAENDPKFDDLSLRKLCKMLKEKLEITNKLGKNDNGNEARARPALQALPDNRRVDETQN